MTSRLQVPNLPKSLRVWNAVEHSGFFECVLERTEFERCRVRVYLIVR